MIALAFSGGKDSWACLWLNEYRLSEISVIWINTGKNYPEALEMIEKARAICPNFIEIKSDRDAQNAVNGIPADIVPVEWTAFGQSQTSKKDVTVQSYFQCCAENIGYKLHQAAKELGVTRLIRGQRLDESHKSVARNGMVVDGIIYEQPIEEWTGKEVIEYLRGKMDIPRHFSFGHTSLDCYDCTAYSNETRDIVQWAKGQHPALYQEYLTRKTALDNALAEAGYGNS